VAPRLGELLVERGECDRATIDEALQAQVVFGGRLGTNLLEAGALSEERLAHALGDQKNVPALYGDLKPEPAALELISSADADRWEVVPLRAAGRKLVLLTLDPGNVAVLDEVAFATGRGLHPFVVPEARLWRLLVRVYGVFREERGLELRRGSGPAEAAPATGPDLIDEDHFHALYGQIGLTPPPFRSPLVPPLPTPRPAETSTPSWLDEPSPLGFQEAVRFLEGVEERGAIARTVLRYARSRFKRAALLTVHGDEAHGWEALGQGVVIDRVHRLKQPLSAEGVVATVVSTRSHFLGPLVRTEANRRLIKAMGGGMPTSAFVIPILALGRVVNVLYVDNGRGELVDPSNLGELLILAGRIAQGYDTLTSRAV
jgi:hypothetical protein